jgi:hypothetical protein
MKTKVTEKSKSRRDFVKKTSAFAAFTAINPFPNIFLSPGEHASIPSHLNGIQIGAVSFVDEGVKNVLDIVQKRGKMNTIFPTVFTYGRGLSGRQIPGQPFPDHGSQVSDKDTFHGGNYSTPHPEFYKNTTLKETRAPELGDFDILAEVVPEAKKRNMKVFASIEDQWRSDVPGIEELYEIDVMGRKANTLCLLRPEVRGFWTGLAKDICSSYDVDGILFFNERNGPLLNALGASHFQTIDPTRVTCFCKYHQKAAKERGIDFERAREGYLKLNDFVQNALKDKRPTDGYYVEFSRLLLEYPEIIAWNELFNVSKHGVLKEVYETVKSVDPKLKVGFHIEHVNSFNPFFRATRSYSDLAEIADFLKVVVYNNAGGERYASFIDNIHSTIFKDVPAEELMRFNNHLLNYSTEEESLNRLPTAGLSPDYVYRETKRAVDGVKGKCLILPGIDIGIPNSDTSRKASPEDTFEAVQAAFKGGADGLILSRKYSEMNLENIDAAGRAISESEKG